MIERSTNKSKQIFQPLSRCLDRPSTDTTCKHLQHKEAPFEARHSQPCYHTREVCVLLVTVRQLWVQAKNTTKGMSKTRSEDAVTGIIQAEKEPQQEEDRLVCRERVQLNTVENWEIVKYEEGMEKCQCRAVHQLFFFCQRGKCDLRAFLKRNQETVTAIAGFTPIPRGHAACRNSTEGRQTNKNKPSVRPNMSIRQVTSTNEKREPRVLFSNKTLRGNRKAVGLGK